MLLSALLIGCRDDREEQQGEQPLFTSYLEIPGVTQEEIDAIEAIKAQGKAFTYGMIPCTESFVGADGELTGASVYICAWLSELFDIPFTLSLHPLDELTEKLKTGELDFTGYFMNIPERHDTFFMTDAIALRPVKYFRLADSEPLPEIREVRVPRYALIEGGATSRSIEQQAIYDFTPVFIANPSDAYDLMVSGEADAFVGPGIMENSFDAYADIVSEFFIPMIYASSSISTQNPELAAFVSVISKALENGALGHVNEMYAKGNGDFSPESTRCINALWERFFSKAG